MLSIRCVFVSEARFQRYLEAVLVFAVSCIGLVCNQAILWLLIERMTLSNVLAKVGATGGVFFWNYGIRRNVIFREPS